MLKRLKDKLYFLKIGYQIMFLYPRDTIETNRSIDYDRYWEERRGDSLGQLTNWQKTRADLALKYIDTKEAISVGDIGCGDGSILLYLKENLNTSSLVGYDISELALKIAEKKGLKTYILDIQKEGDLEHIQETDYILMFEVLEHISHSERLLEHALKRSRRGVFFSFPNTGFFLHRFRLFFGKVPMQWREYPNTHLRFWTLVDLRWWLRAQGYEGASVVSYKGVPILNRLWPNLFAAGLFVYIKKGS